MELTPLTLKEARRFVARHHRTHPAPQGGLFAIGAAVGEDIIGVAIVGVPVSRLLADGYTAEVRRLCVLENRPNACSFLYGACWRAARSMGYRKLITYTGSKEPGTSLRAAGWRLVGTTKAQSWDRPSRPRVDTSPPQQRQLWDRMTCQSPQRNPQQAAPAATGANPVSLKDTPID